DEALVVAGGAKFPDQRPWEGGTKQWYDSIWRLDDPGGQWRIVGQLPRPTAYGLSAVSPAGCMYLGGGDATSHFRDAYWVFLRGGAVEFEPLPPLPQACAFASGAVAGKMLYVAGGIERPDASACLRTLWALDLSNPDHWQVLEACPGPERMLAVAGAVDDDFYLFSGARLHASAQGPPTREYLRDAWRYRPGSGWKKLADLPRAAVAAPSPAARWSEGKLAILSGDDGKHVGFKPEAQHPGFPRDALIYDVAANRWSSGGKVPFSRATAPTTLWRNEFVIPSGEERPGYRSPKVWALDLP
ncbi:MAG TPA: hypothetical protein VG713_10595, partial [Pirellulales bacterium]|nr:hypothetical protein [Pirellulales bacterium]